MFTFVAAMLQSRFSSSHMLLLPTASHHVLGHSTPGGCPYNPFPHRHLSFLVTFISPTARHGPDYICWSLKSYFIPHLSSLSQHISFSLSSKPAGLIFMRIAVALSVASIVRLTLHFALTRLLKRRPLPNLLFPRLELFVGLVCFYGLTQACTAVIRGGFADFDCFRMVYFFLCCRDTDKVSHITCYEPALRTTRSLSVLWEFFE